MPEPYNPTRDLATLLHAARGQGFWSPAPRRAISRLEHELGLTSTTLASEIEELLHRREMARRMAVRTMEHEIPVALARQAAAAIEEMGDAVPLPLKRLWGYLLPAEAASD
jgi:hypothetical protein